MFDKVSTCTLVWTVFILSFGSFKMRMVSKSSYSGEREVNLKFQLMLERLLISNTENYKEKKKER
jgi:hypothetical protein